MKRENFDATIDRLCELLTMTVDEERDELLEALEKNDGKITISFSVSVNAWTKGADLEAKIGYVVERRNNKMTAELEFAQEPLPGMPEATKTGRKAAPRG
jgi:hypothetical protein